MKKFKYIFAAIAAVVAFAACTYVEDVNRPAVQPMSHQEAVTIGENTAFPLAGMMSIPLGASAQSPVPAVVIVAGSGASDMDGNMFGIRPYYDIARFLADNGIASIRHDKRTLTHIAQFDPSWTVYEEAMADALLAAEILRNDPRIDSDRIYIIGHSLGGILAPRINNLPGGDFAGLIIMGASPRSLLDVAVEQIQEQIDIGRAAIEAFMLTPEAQVPEILEIAMAQAAEIEMAQLTVDGMVAFAETLPGMTAEQALANLVPVFGAFPLYWYDLFNNPMEQDLALANVTMLFLQGARDFQVLADVDFVMLQEIMAGRDDATFILYENLNHNFLPSNATNIADHTAEMMMSTDTVSPEVLRDIVNWILR